LPPVTLQCSESARYLVMCAPRSRAIAVLWIVTIVGIVQNAIAGPS